MIILCVVCMCACVCVSGSVCMIEIQIEKLIFAKADTYLERFGWIPCDRCACLSGNAGWEH